MKPEAGKFYTMSENKRYRDRSWISYVWDVIARNETHAIIIAVGGRSYSSFGKEPQIVAIAEFDWTPAEDLAAALSGYSTTEAARG